MSRYIANQFRYPIFETPLPVWRRYSENRKIPFIHNYIPKIPKSIRFLSCSNADARYNYIDRFSNSVRPSVWQSDRRTDRIARPITLTRSGIVSKRLNISSYFPQPSHSSIPNIQHFAKFRQGPCADVLNTISVSCFISQRIQDRPIVNNSYRVFRPWMTNRPI